MEVIIYNEDVIVFQLSEKNVRFETNRILAVWWIWRTAAYSNAADSISAWKPLTINTNNFQNPKESSLQRIKITLTPPYWDPARRTGASWRACGTVPSVPSASSSHPSRPCRHWSPPSRLSTSSGQTRQTYITLTDFPCLTPAPHRENRYIVFPTTKNERTRLAL